MARPDQEPCSHQQQQPGTRMNGCRMSDQRPRQLPDGRWYRQLAMSWATATTLRHAGLATICAAAVAASGCGLTPNMQSARLYALAVPASTSQARCAVSFGIRDVRLAGHLDRAEIVIARSGAVIQTSPLDVWAAPLRDDLRRIIGRSLAQRWDGSRLLPHPWRFGEVPVLAIDLQAEQLEPQGTVFEANVYWQMLRQTPTPATAAGVPAPALATGVFRQRLPMQGNDAAAAVAAMNNALSALADELSRQGVGESGLAQLCRTS